MLSKMTKSRNIMGLKKILQREIIKRWKRRVHII